MKTSTEINELSKALTAFQKSAPKIVKDKTAKLGTYQYKYADLSSIMDAVRGGLADNGLAVIQSPSSYQTESTLTTMITHESGQWISDTMNLKVMQETPQGQGSAITYARRYMLTAMLGIVADDDNDAQDNKGLSTIQKKQIYDTAKRVLPEVSNDPLSMVRFLSEVIGKHPNRLHESEFEDAIMAIEAYKTEQQL